MNIVQVIATLPNAYLDITALGKAITTALADPAVKLEVNSHPDVKAVVDRISLEWRNVENAEIGVKKSNILTFFHRAQVLLSNAKVLEADVAHEQRDPALAEGLATMPKTLAALSAVSEQWVKVENDLKVLH